MEATVKGLASLLLQSSESTRHTSCQSRVRHHQRNSLASPTFRLHAAGDNADVPPVQPHVVQRLHRLCVAAVCVQARGFTMVR